LRYSSDSSVRTSGGNSHSNCSSACGVSVAPLCRKLRDNKLLFVWNIRVLYSKHLHGSIRELNQFRGSLGASDCFRSPKPRCYTLECEESRQLQTVCLLEDSTQADHVPVSSRRHPQALNRRVPGGAIQDGVRSTRVTRPVQSGRYRVTSLTREALGPKAHQNYLSQT
jgi:hypothetical protein